MPADTAPISEDCHCLVVRAASRQITQFYDQFLAPSGLRTSQFSILARLRRRGPLTINALAADMIMDRTTLGRNIRPLQRNGWVSIAPAPSDRRAKELHLTKEGEKRFRIAAKGWLAAQAKFENLFGANRAADLRALLRAIVTTELPAVVDHGEARSSGV
jgi:DNA-binding MarR family transcriptional regulator